MTGAEGQLDQTDYDQYLRVFYYALGLEPGATEQQVESRYRFLIKLVHTDRWQQGTADYQHALTMSQKLNSAYEMLQAAFRQERQHLEATRQQRQVTVASPRRRPAAEQDPGGLDTAVEPDASKRNTPLRRWGFVAGVAFGLVFIALVVGALARPSAFEFGQAPAFTSPTTSPAVAVAGSPRESVAVTTPSNSVPNAATSPVAAASTVRPTPTIKYLTQTGVNGANLRIAPNSLATSEGPGYKDGEAVEQTGDEEQHDALVFVPVRVIRDGRKGWFLKVWLSDAMPPPTAIPSPSPTSQTH